LDVGNCRADHRAIAILLRSNFDVQVLRAVHADEAMDALEANQVDLVLVNRVIDKDGSGGVELIRRIKGDASLAAIPVMLLSNYADYQDAAVAAGAERGFGKASLGTPDTVQRLSRILTPPKDGIPLPDPRPAAR